MVKNTGLCILILMFSFTAVAANFCRALINSSQKSAYASEITVIVGTDRKASKSSLIAKEVLKQLQQNPHVVINLVNLTDLPKNIFKSDYFEGKSASFTKNFVSPIERSQAIIFVIPEYDGAVPGVLSYYLNHMRTSFDKKYVALIGLSAGKWGARAALDAFKGTITHRQGRVLGDLQVNIENIENKTTANEVTDIDTLKRIQISVQELIKTLNMADESANKQMSLAQLAMLMRNSSVSIKLNNDITIEGNLNNLLLNENLTPAYIQMSGPTRLKQNQQVIEGQDTNVHASGYGMPIGAIHGYPKNWYKKSNLPFTIAKGLKLSSKIKLTFESGIIVSGTVKNLTYDSNGNLLIITFTDASVKKGQEVLFDKNWGDFDMAVGDYIEKITPTQIIN